MNCKNCHVGIPDDSAFCPNCGKAINSGRNASAYFSREGDINTSEAVLAPKTSESSRRKFCVFCGNMLPLNARYCSQCGKDQSLKSHAPDAVFVKFKKRSATFRRNLLWVIPVLAVLALVILYAGIRSAAPWYDLRSDGTFTVNEKMWRFFCNPFQSDQVTIEIPRKYDGEINNYAGNQRNFSYDGTLAQLISNHPWVLQLQLPSRNGHDYTQIKCKDYTVKYGHYTDPLRDASLGASSYLPWVPQRYLNTNCIIIREDGKYLPFQSIADMKLWIREGIYHLVWSNDGLWGDWSIHDEYFDSEDVEFANSAGM